MEKLKQIQKEKNPEIDNVLSGVNLKKKSFKKSAWCNWQLNECLFSAELRKEEKSTHIYWVFQGSLNSWEE